jgi:lipooligosaccharide transport system permease protein
MEWIMFVLMPMFMFSATFFPISVYPEPLQWLVMALPLWHGVELIRGLTTGAVGPDALVHVLYYLVMIAIGLYFTTRRLRALFLD